MKRLFSYIALVLSVIILASVTGCTTSVERANDKHEREKLEKPQPPPRL